VNSIRKISGDKIRLKLPLWGVPEIFAFTITSAHQDTARSRVAGKLDVAVAIADDEGAVQGDGVLAGSALEHACLWLATVATVGRCVRAVVYGVEMGAGRFELLGHEFMDRVYQRFRKIAAANAGLICHNNHRKPSLIQAANRIGDMRQDTKSADVIQVADFFGDGAVAIEKNGGVESAGFRQDVPPWTKSTAARRLRQRRG
jgi:hypothetical protein